MVLIYSPKEAVGIPGALVILSFILSKGLEGGKVHAENMERKIILS